jgi:RNA polymerase sigma-70 factor, ECF subfamily
LADDLAQETFIRLLRYADRYDAGYPMRTWLFTIARRLSINHGRRADSQVTSTQYLGMRSDTSDPAGDAERSDSRRALGERLDAALAQLSEPQRVTLVMFHQQDLSIDQIAQTLDMPTGTVKSHLHRGRAAMRKVLGSQEDVESQSA